MQISPSQHSGFDFARVWQTGYDANHLKSVIRLIMRAFFPVPEVHTAFWNTNFLDNYPFGAKIQIILSFLLAIWCFLALLRRPTALLIYFSGTIGLLILFYTKYFGSIRHHGFLFILFIMALWMQPYCGEAKFFAWTGRFARLCQKSLNPILTGILFFHLVGGIIAVLMDNQHVFSYGKAAAAFIKERKMQNLVMVVGEKEYAMSAVIGYLEKDRVYYPRRAQFGSFIRWDQAWASDFTDGQAVRKAKELGAENKQDILFILSHELSANLISQYSLIELKKSTSVP
jgi:hypothetical protein